MKRYSEQHFIQCIQSLFDNNDVYKNVYNEESNLYKIILFIARYYDKRNEKDFKLSRSLLLDNPSLDVLLLAEQSYGIPDDVFPLSSTYADRLKYLSIKKYCSLVGVWEVEDFIYLASLFGITNIKFESYTEAYQLDFDSNIDVVLYSDNNYGHYHWLIHLPKQNENDGFDSEFDYEFLSSSNLDLDIYKALIMKLKRSHVEVEFVYDL